MWCSKFKQYLAAFLLCSTVSTVQAASLSIQPAGNATGSVLRGSYFQMDVYMDFSDDPTIGGGFDILFDPALVSYVEGSFLINEGLFSDPALSRDDNLASLAANRVDIDASQGKIIGAAFGDWIGLAGPSLVGSMTFLAENSGLANFALSATENLAVGNFVSTFTLEEQNVSFTGSSVHISPIPVPAAFWLMLSGLTGLVAVTRRKAA